MTHVYAALHMIAGGVPGLLAAAALALALFGTYHLLVSLVNAFCGEVTKMNDMDIWIPAIAWAVWWYLGAL